MSILSWLAISLGIIVYWCTMIFTVAILVLIASASSNGRFWPSRALVVLGAVFWPISWIILSIDYLRSRR